MILHTEEIKYLGEYRISLSFNNGERGEVDLSGELDGDIFEPLRDKSIFSTVHQHPVMKTAAWTNGADLAPEFLLDLMHQQNQIAA